MDFESQKFKYHKLNTDSSSLVAVINPNFSISQDHLPSFSNAPAVSKHQKGDMNEELLGARMLKGAPANSMDQITEEEDRAEIELIV